MMESDRIETLVSRCVHHVVDHLPDNEPLLETMPAAIKDRLIHLMCKRGRLTDANISQFLHDKVRCLDLSECEVTDAGLRLIASKCRYLRKIDLNSAKSSRTEITSDGVVALAGGCPYLQVVYLRRCLRLTDPAVVALSQSCRTLRDLNVGGCPDLTDLSLEALADNCPHLRSLNFCQSKVTDDGVVRLVSGAPANSLREVHMNGCRLVTDEAVEAVLQFCPNIDILLFHGCPNITERSREALEELQSGSQVKMKQVTWTIYC